MEWLQNGFHTNCRQFIHNMGMKCKQAIMKRIDKKYIKIRQVVRMIQTNIDDRYQQVVQMTTNTYHHVMEMLSKHHHCGIAIAIPAVVHCVYFINNIVMASNASSNALSSLNASSLPSFVMMALHGPLVAIVSDESNTHHLFTIMIAMLCFILYHNPYYLMYIYFIYYVTQITNPSSDTNKICFVNYLFFICVIKYSLQPLESGSEFAALHPDIIDNNVIEGLCTMLSMLTMYGCCITKTKTTLDVYLNNAILLHTFLFYDERCFTLKSYNAVYLTYWLKIIYKHIYHNHNGALLVSMAFMLVIAIDEPIAFGSSLVEHSASYSIHSYILLLVCIAELVVKVVEFEATIFQHVHKTKVSLHRVSLMGSTNHYRMMMWLLIKYSTDFYAALLFLYMSAWVQLMECFYIGYEHSLYQITYATMYSLYLIFTIDGSVEGDNVGDELQYGMMVMYATILFSEYVLTHKPTPFVVQLLYGIVGGLVYRKESSTSLVSMSTLIAITTPLAVDDIIATALMILCSLDIDNAGRFPLYEQVTVTYIGSCIMFLVALIKLLNKKRYLDAGKFILYLQLFTYTGMVEIVEELEREMSLFTLSVNWNYNSHLYENYFIDTGIDEPMNTFMSKLNINDDYVVMMATLIFIVLIGMTREL